MSFFLNIILMLYFFVLILGFFSDSSVPRFHGSLPAQVDPSGCEGHYGVKCWICSFDSSMLQNGMVQDAAALEDVRLLRYIQNQNGAKTCGGGAGCFFFKVDLRTGHLMVDLKFGATLGNGVLPEPCFLVPGCMRSKYVRQLLGREEH